MAAPLVGPVGGSGDTLLPATGFGPGTIVIAVIGGVLTALGAVTHRFGKRRTVPAPSSPAGWDAPADLDTVG